MTDTERILDEISQGPLPMHVLRRRTGLEHGLEVALRPLVQTGQVVRHGEMVALPVPSYVTPVQEIETGDDHTEQWQTDEEGRLISDPVPVGGLEGLVAQVMPSPMEGPPPEDVVDAEVHEVYLVATEWQMVEAVNGEQAATQVMVEHETGQALVMLAEEALIFERALVTRRRS